MKTCEKKCQNQQPEAKGDHNMHDLHTEMARYFCAIK